MKYNSFNRNWVFGIVIILYISTFIAVANDSSATSIDEGSISGHVFQVNGNPIAGATVEVMRQDEGGWWETYSESDGSYSISGLPTGNYKVRTFKQGYAREYYDNVFSSTEVTIVNVNAPDETTGIDFTLTLGGSISGHVYQIDGVTPIAGADVFVCPSKYRVDDGFWSITDSNGGYTVENLYLGNYKVTAKAEGYVELINYYNSSYGWVNAWDVFVTPPNETPGIDIKLERAGSISGFVYESDGVTPIPDVNVVADDPTGKFVEGFGTSSNDDGSYNIQNILPGIYTVRTEPPLSSWYAGEVYDSKYNWITADHVDVYEGIDTPDIDFTLDEGGSITGQVFDEETNEPLERIELFAYLPDGTEIPTIGGTIYNGSYKFVLKPGEYIIGIGKEDYCVLGNKYVPEWYDDVYNFSDATPVNIDIYTETQGIDFYLAKSGSVSGYVYDKNGEPISDASIYAYSDIYSGGGANTQSDGSYKIEGLPSGYYFVQVTVSGYNSEYYDDVTDQADATFVVVDAPDETTGIDFVLTKGIDVYLSRPEKGVFYLFDTEFLSTQQEMPIIFGDITVRAVAFGCDEVEFYVDDILKHTDDESPFSWVWDEFVVGKHNLKVVVYEGVDVINDEMEVWIFNI